MNTAISIVAIIMSVLSLLISLVAIVMVLAQKWSTHKIEWKPLVTESLEKEEEEAEEESDDELLERAKFLNQNKKKFKEVDPLASLETSHI